MNSEGEALHCCQVSRADVGIATRMGVFAAHGMEAQDAVPQQRAAWQLGVTASLGAKLQGTRFEAPNVYERETGVVELSTAEMACLNAGRSLDQVGLLPPSPDTV